MKRFSEMQNELKEIEEMQDEEQEEKEEEKNEEETNHELTANDKKLLLTVANKIFIFQKLTAYIEKNMKTERSNTLIKLEEQISKLKEIKNNISKGKSSATTESIKKQFPDENDIKLLTGLSVQEKNQKIANFKNVVKSSLDNAKERKLKEQMINHFKPMLQYMNKIQTNDKIPFPLLELKEKKIPMRVVNKNIPKGVLRFDLMKMTNCPNSRFFYVKAEFNYKGKDFVYDSKINKNGGEFGHFNNFNLESERKINAKIGSTKMKLSLHKQHLYLLFKYRLVSEVEIPLDRLLTETNAVYSVDFPYKNNTTLNVQIKLSTHEAIRENLATIKLLSIKKIYPEIDFMGQSIIKNTSNISK